MTADFARLEEIFTAAVAKTDPAERAAYLDDACAGDADLRKRLEDLLAADAGSATFLPLPAEDSTVTFTPVSERPGSVIGRYKLLEQIGEGGFGVVFMAEQEQPIRRRVALKIIKAGMDTRQVVARFEAERQALAMMDHPNIARVFDGGATETGRPYFVMELVRGVPITEYCDKHRLSITNRLELFQQVCQAVQHAHQKGVIHRDLKPTNILVGTQDDRPVAKVIDFGVAKAIQARLTERTLFTEFRQLIGTPVYMSPEQAEGGFDVDTRSDVYSLGVLLYELLVGTPPFSSKELRSKAFGEMQRIIREVEPPTPSSRLNTLTDNLPSVAAQRAVEPRKLVTIIQGELDWIVMRALEKDRTRRYPTANALALDIGWYLNDEPVQACPPSAFYRLRKFARRNKPALATAIMVAASLLLGIILSVWQATLARRAERTARYQEQLAQEQKLIAEQREETVRHQLYSAGMTLAEQGLETGNISRTLEILEAQRPKLGSKDLRGFEWYYLWHRCHEDHRATLRGHSGTVFSISISPDGSKLASGGADGLVKLWDLPTGRGLCSLEEHTGAVRTVAFSPDGNLVASAGDDRRIRLWDISSLRLVATLIGHSQMVRCITFSSDGNTLASGSQDQTIRLWDVSARRQLKVLTAHTSRINFLAFSPNGETLVSCADSDPILLWEVSSGRNLCLEGHRFIPRHLAFSTDGKMIASSGQDGIVKLWNSEQAIQQLKSHQIEEYPKSTSSVAAPVAILETETVAVSLAFSNDNKSILTAGDNGEVTWWDLGTNEPLHRFAHGCEVISASLSPDGELIASAGTDATIKLWNVPTPAMGENREPKPTGRNYVWAVAFSPDGNTLASAGDDQLVTLRDVRTLRVRKKLRGHNNYIIGLAYASDGRTLASTGDDGTIRLWDTATGKQKHVIQASQAAVYSVAFSPNGKLLASGGGDQIIRLWDLATTRQMFKLQGHTCWVWSVAFSPDGSSLASVSAEQYLLGELKLWDVATGREKFNVPKANMTAVFSPDGGGVATMHLDGTVKIWDSSTGKEIYHLKGYSGFHRALALSRDGSTLVAIDHEGNVAFWDLQSRQLRATLKSRGGDVWSLAMSPDGRMLATGDSDGVVELWQTATEADVVAQSSRAVATGP